MTLPTDTRHKHVSSSSLQNAAHVTLPARSKRRPAWRQRLIDAERGFSLSFRADSTLFVHAFLVCIIVAAGSVLQISLIEWTMIILALSLVVAAEMFNLVLRTLTEQFATRFEHDLCQSVRMGTAAVFVTIAGATLVVTLIFCSHLSRIFGG